MESSRELLEKAKTVIPKQGQDEVYRSTRWWIAVVLHGVDSPNERDFVEGDFLWMRGHQNVTVKTCKKSYFERIHVHVKLKAFDFDGVFPDDDTTMKEITPFPEKLVVFQAFREGETSETHDAVASAPTVAAPSSRAPLQPTMRQLPAGSAQTLDTKRDSHAGNLAGLDKSNGSKSDCHSHPQSTDEKREREASLTSPSIANHRPSTAHDRPVDMQKARVDDLLRPGLGAPRHFSQRPQTQSVSNHVQLFDEAIDGVATPPPSLGNHHHSGSGQYENVKGFQGYIAGAAHPLPGPFAHPMDLSAYSAPALPMYQQQQNAYLPSAPPLYQQQQNAYLPPAPMYQQQQNAYSPPALPKYQQQQEVGKPSHIPYVSRELSGHAPKAISHKPVPHISRARKLAGAVDVPPEIPPLPVAQAVQGYFGHSTEEGLGQEGPPADSGENIQDTPMPEPLPFDNKYLHQLVAKDNGHTVEMLEAGVAKGKQFLRQLEHTMRMKAPEVNPGDVDHWITQTHSLLTEKISSRTVIGVVGNTGAGKSSVINAMLEEERLVPTNCMRACTAVVTEISHNDCDEDGPKYRAEIEFITHDDWRKELTLLFKDLIGPDGQVSKECTDPDKDSGIAYAKIKAIWPQMTKDMMTEANIENLLNNREVRDVLGSTIKIKENDCAAFYRKLQVYVDSKEKVDEEEKEKNKDKKKEKKEKRKMEHWPLIRVVKIYTKAEALSTGAVVVDLPGVQDSNAARAAVAEGYMKQCTGLWIVAPITRAVDDKAAKKLLGSQFKRQMQYDGTYNNVTFICSKTDDISITEAADTLGLDEEIAEQFEECNAMEQELEELQERVNDVLRDREMYSDIITSTSDLSETWSDLQSDFQAGKTVYAPRDNKRKRNGEHKRRGHGFFASQDTSESDSSEKSDEDMDDDDEVKEQPLTTDQIKSKLDELKQKRDEAKASRDSTTKLRRENIKRQREVTAKIESLKSAMSSVCIAGRNAYSKQAIQRDFAAGIKELDQENDEMDNPDSFDPEVERRDYEEVARSLPVFCVSSRAYQKERGRLQKDSVLSGFSSLEQTEIPQLQKHCMKLTEEGRANGCRSFLNRLNSFINSLWLWSSTTSKPGVLLTQPQQDAQIAFLRQQLTTLQNALEIGAGQCLSKVKDDLNRNLYRDFNAGIDHAKQNGLPTAESWGRSTKDGGMYWATYKATCRRDGLFREFDFNRELSEPMLKCLSKGWERTFTRILPKTLCDWAEGTDSILRRFHQSVEEFARRYGAVFANLNFLANQLPVYVQSFRDLVVEMVSYIGGINREANRAFTPVVKERMQPAYVICVDHCGLGSYKRMKDSMAEHVGQHKETMFQDAAAAVKAQLSEIVKSLKAVMENQVNNVVDAMRRDYCMVMGSAVRVKLSTPEVESLNGLKEMIEKDVHKSRKMFAALLGAECTPEPPQHATAERAEMLNADAMEVDIAEDSMDMTEHKQHQPDARMNKDGQSASLVNETSAPQPGGVFVVPPFDGAGGAFPASIGDSTTPASVARGATADSFMKDVAAYHATNSMAPTIGGEGVALSTDATVANDSEMEVDGGNNANGATDEKGQGRAVP